MTKHVLWVTAKDTIAAIATASGPGSVSIIRLSGPSCRKIVQKLCKIKIDILETNTFKYTKIFNLQGDLIDQALILNFVSPKSFTGEDVIEIQCHGGSFCSKSILEACLVLGARMAEPGEFSFRAFRNQKIDLCQAESLSALVSAKTSFASDAAKEQLSGALSKRIENFQKNITKIVAILEAMIDYPEEGIHYPSTHELCKEITLVQEEIYNLMASFNEGKRLSDAIRVGLIGRANVGKSSLLNLLLMKERAIVTDQAGTTRDQIEEEIELNGQAFRFIDTAGIRNTDDQIEMMGIERSRAVMQKADLILFLLDSNQEIQQDEKVLIETLNPEKSLLIFNKSDLAQKQANTTNLESLALSTKTSAGLETLKKWLLEQAQPPSEALFITQQRHFNALKKAHQKLILAKTNLQSAPAEIAAIDLRESLEFLAQIIGKNISEEILSSIFKNFCVGK